MMPEIKLFMFQSGTQHCRYQHIRMNQGVGEHYEIPVPWFLLTHPDGFTLIDGGLAVEGLKDPSGYWGSAVEQFKPVMSEEQGCVEQLKRIGIAPEDIRYVVLSHLHSDHTGAIGRFPHATHVVQRQEYEYAFAPDWFTSGAYCRRDFDRPQLNWLFLNGLSDDHYDLYGDGTLQCIFTPGHSPGHQSFIIRLPGGTNFTLAIDAAYTLDHYHEKALPGLMTSATDVAQSVRKLRQLTERYHAVFISGHDPEEWKKNRLAPACYY
ncbi:N-acyl homoserine lactonase AhlK [Klebsiella pneumoniae]|nr:N-acyl homoserine lactonase family protein [Klebsiella pneumoniae]MEA4504632.1 N-acyl homoserine lactonase family protein [Klebsiella pneumoniae]HBS7933425.1 N-acyl homoserine lactonase family protein [Klebsiella pneumoniae]HEE5216663.1 N-acyl homoserine lactonase family protein [Klebsiella pneumoniae]